jgi:hypothetical protein
MAVKVSITIECVDWDRAKVLMSGLLGIVDAGIGGGDEVKIGFQREIKMGRRKRKITDEHTWIYGEARPELSDLGFSVVELPLDAMLRSGSRSSTIAPESTLSAFRRAADGDDDE